MQVYIGQGVRGNARFSRHFKTDVTDETKSHSDQDDGFSFGGEDTFITLVLAE